MEIKIVIDFGRMGQWVKRTFSSGRARVALAAGIVFTPLLVYAAQVTKPYTFTDGTAVSAAQVNANFDTLTNAVNTIDTRTTALEKGQAWCYACNASSSSTTSSSWTDVSGWSECVITTTGNPVMFMAEYSIYIQTDHSGMRVVMDPGTSSQKVFGEETTYGIDWQSDETNYWIKRSMMRVFTGIPAGTHRFRMQYRSQANGYTTQVHGGNCSTYYSGSHMFMQELK